MKELFIPCTIYRGGTSRGVFFQDTNLPPSAEERDHIFYTVIGTPDKNQIDGLGGGLSHTSKIAVLSPGSEDCDINYMFGQVGIDKNFINYTRMCGNLLSAVGLYAVHNGFVKPKEGRTKVRVYNTNLNYYLNVFVPSTINGALNEGDYEIAGVRGCAPRIDVEFPRPSGFATGSIFPTGKKIDVISTKTTGDIEISIVDGLNVYVYVRASDLGISCTTSVQTIESSERINNILQEIRAKAAVLCGFVDSEEAADIKSPINPNGICVVDYPTPHSSNDADIWIIRVTRGKVHSSFPITGMITTSLAASLKGTIVEGFCRALGPKHDTFNISHPAGVSSVFLKYSSDETAPIDVAQVARTARCIAKATAIIPVKEK